jgi:hypothetical protein
LPNKLWESLAESFEKKGYFVIFNVKKNNNDKNNYILSNKFPSVQIPAYLVPLIAEKIAYTIARWGGGFDLAHSYSKTSKCILLAFSNDFICEKGRQEDPPINLAKDLFLNFCNKEVFKILSLNELKLNNYLENQINQIENV